MSLTANWSYPTAIRFGAGRLGELAEACAALGIKRPLLVTDAGLADLPITARALKVLEQAGRTPGLFSKVQPNPTEKNVDEGITAYRTGDHDGVVAFGGGSGLDTGKLIAFMQGQTRPVWDFEDIGDWWTRANAEAIAPIVAVPTTAGTGSEFGRAGVVTNSETHVKKIIFHPKMLPGIVICDPELTVGLPPAVTAGTGMDAFIHSLEAYCSPYYHPMSHGIALEGMRLVKDYLPRAHSDGKDIEARAHMLAASGMGAVAFQKGLGGIHALSHPVSAVFGAHHGTANACIMPAVLRFNRPAIEDKIVRLAAYLGIAGGFDGFMDYIMGLRAALGIPDSLGDLGVDGDRLDEMAAMAADDPSCGGNPVPLNAEILKGLYEACL